MSLPTRRIVALALLGPLVVASIASETEPPLFPPWNPLPFEYSEGQMAPRREIRDPCIVREGDRCWLVFTCSCS